jgi:branched-chain amino acid transport system permease protein
MMRFRPEGLIPNKRNQLQFHEDDEELVELIQEGHLEEVEAMEEAK